MSRTYSTIKMLRELVAFDTTSHKSNLELIRFIQEYLASFQISSEIIGDESGTKANLLASIGPSDRPGIILSGHTDVVPALETDWISPPFELSERDGKLFGRGSADMKGFIAAVLAAVPRFVTQDLHYPIHLAFSYDEELGCLGVRRLLPAISKLPTKPKLCIVGEPTMMRVVTGHKGKVLCHTHVHGLACHSAQAPRGVNAIEYAAEVISFIRSEAQRLRCEGPFDSGYVVPHTTVSVGPISGGSVTNVVAADCEFSWEIRHLPNADPMPIVERVNAYAENQLRPEMQATGKDTFIQTSVRNSYPGLDMDTEQNSIQLLFSLLGSNARGKVDFGTEGGFFHAVAGIPALVCGPGDISVAHKSNEYVELTQLQIADQFLARLAAHLALPDAFRSA